jgi:4-hydroxy-tetrahydrodipicolinate synthase
MATTDTPFGRVLTAMVTPMTPDGSVDYDGAQRLALHLLDHGSDGLVINGTTGESGTTTDAEKSDLLRAVADATAGRDVPLLAGVGTLNTAHSVELAREAAKAGATGTLVVTPYYSKPSQAGLRAHFETVAGATDLPVMLYDIPSRSGVPIDTETLVELAAHPQIVAVKDAKNDLVAASWLQARCDLVTYSGSDEFTLPLLSIGAVGVVSVASHIAGEQLRQMIDAYSGGDTATARRLHLQLLPLFVGLFRTASPTLTKAALRLLGLPAGPLRSPLIAETEAQLAQLRLDLDAAGIAVGADSA